MEFHHAGIATTDTAELASLYTDLLGASAVHEECFDGMTVVFLDLGNGFFELLEPHEGGPVARFIEDRGSGIHHLALETDDLDGALETARALDVESIDEEPRPGAWGHEVAFLHPASTGGVLIEFVGH